MRFACAGLLAIAMGGCGGNADTVSQGDADVYVPGATRVVPVAGLGGVRRPLQVSESRVLVLGEDIGRPVQFQIATTDDGKLFAVDIYDGHVRGFDPEGAPVVWTESAAEVLELGRAPLGIAMLGENLLMSNAYPGQLRLIAPSGEVVSDVEFATSPWLPAALSEGTFVAMELETGVVGRYSTDFDEIARYTVFRFPEGELGGAKRLWAAQDFVVGAQRVYVTTAEQHQVAAFDIDGDNVWVLEGDVARIPIPENVSGKTLGRSRRAGRAAGATVDTEYANVKWPEYYPALARIATDAHDRLYVFPYVVEENPDQYPVDIYDATGRQIVRGWLPFQGWDAFVGDSVYRVEKRGGLWIAVRYDLVIPNPDVASAAGQ